MLRCHLCFVGLARKPPEASPNRANQSVRDPVGLLSSHASSAASLPPMRRPNHASRFEGIAKTNLQASRASDTETLQSQVNKAAKKRLSLNGLEILHGRQKTFP